MTCPHFPYSLSGFYLLYIPVICFYSLVVAAGHSSSSAVILEYLHLISYVQSDTIWVWYGTLIETSSHPNLLVSFTRQDRKK